MTSNYHRVRRMIPADEAQALLENATPGSWAWGADDNISYTLCNGEPVEQGCSWRYVVLGAWLDNRGDPIVVYPWEATEWNENENPGDEFYEPTVLADEQLSELDAALIAAAPDLAHTVVEQAALIKQLDTERASDGKGWLQCETDEPSVWAAPGGRVMVQRIEPGDLTPAQARDLAHSLLEAAQRAEQEHQ